MRKLPFIGKPDLNPTHINVRVPEYWRRLALGLGYEILDEWMGEHLTHIKFVPSVLSAIPPPPVPETTDQSVPVPI